MTEIRCFGEFEMYVAGKYYLYKTIDETLWPVTLSSSDEGVAGVSHCLSLNKRIATSLQIHIKSSIVMTCTFAALL
jgi:hypothetical protein